MSLRLTDRQLAALQGRKPIPKRLGGEAACDLLAFLLGREHIMFTREYKFCAGRGFRFDFALHIYRLAIEVDGAVHRIENRFREDREKFNIATRLRWRVIHVTPAEVRSGEAMKLIKEMIAS